MNDQGVEDCCCILSRSDPNLLLGLAFPSLISFSRKVLDKAFEARRGNKELQMSLVTLFHRPRIIDRCEWKALLRLNGVYSGGRQGSWTHSFYPSH